MSAEDVETLAAGLPAALAAAQAPWLSASRRHDPFHRAVSVGRTRPPWPRAVPPEQCRVPAHLGTVHRSHMAQNTRPVSVGAVGQKH